MNDFQHILDQLPYTKPFLFVNKLTALTEDRVEGEYTFTEDEYFYKGHFKDKPVTPGVILTECMAQIGVVCLGISLIAINSLEEVQIALSSHAIDFYKPVFPGETVRVISEKEYFRFKKLKCKVKMLNAKDEVVCKGARSGMVYGH
jgi:3-hydroxyacyl-[acyl-carrier-protein] dehydratase